MLPFFAGLSHDEGHCIFAASRSALWRGRRPIPEDAMSNLSYVTDLQAKISLRPSRQAIKRAALALALSLGVAAAADFGYGYLTTGRYLETTDDAYVKANSTIISPKVSGYIARSAGRRQRAGQGRPVAGADRRPRFPTALNQAQADVAASEAAVRNLDAQIELAAADHRAAGRRGRRGRSQSEIRAGRTRPLRRSDEVRLRHRAARPADRRGAARKDRAVAAAASPA